MTQIRVLTPRKVVIRSLSGNCIRIVVANFCGKVMAKLEIVLYFLTVTGAMRMVNPHVVIDSISRILAPLSLQSLRDV
jgi:hypothetical protein